MNANPSISRNALALAAGLALVAAGTGCTVPVHAQRLLAKPAMQFAGAGTAGGASKLLPQVETGAAASGGGQAAGCTSCR